MTLLPKILEKTQLFLKRLDLAAANGEVVKMDNPCMDLTFDIIGSVVLDVDMNTQLPEAQEDPIIKSMKYLLECYERADDLLTEINPVLIYRRKRRGKVFDAAVKEAIKGKFLEMKAGHRENEKGRSVLALALQDLTVLTPAALSETADQIKTFLFAGHDTTSTTLQWAFYELSRSPQALRKLYAELDDVLGTSIDPKHIADTLLARGEEALQRLTYLSAVIKETLRLYPPAASARMSPPGSGFTIRAEDGREWCIDGLVAYNCHHIIGRDPKVFGPDAEIFNPERWIGDTDTGETDAGEKTNLVTHESEKGENKLPASAWRPFERGPRNCIGQALANLEVRVILASTVRRYRFHKVGMGALLLGEDGKPMMNEKGQYTVVDELVSRRQVTGKPIDGMPMRITLTSLEAQ
jgi:cytochrome P450